MTLLRYLILLLRYLILLFLQCIINIWLEFRLFNFKSLFQLRFTLFNFSVLVVGWSLFNSKSFQLRFTLFNLFFRFEFSNRFFFCESLRHALSSFLHPITFLTSYHLSYLLLHFTRLRTGYLFLMFIFYLVSVNFKLSGIYIMNHSKTLLSKWNESQKSSNS